MFENDDSVGIGGKRTSKHEWILNDRNLKISTNITLENITYLITDEKRSKPAADLNIISNGNKMKINFSLRSVSVPNIKKCYIGPVENISS